MSERIWQYANALIPPASAAAAASLLHTCDPTLEGLLAACKWILNTQLMASFAGAAQGFAADTVVADTYAVEPIPEVARATWTWPALIAYRGTSRYGLRTLYYDGHETEVHLVYALPPLTLEYLQRLGHLRVAVARTVRAFIEQKWHPDYNGGADWLHTIGVDQLALVESTETDVFERSDMSMTHVGVHMLLMMKEREEVYTADLQNMTQTAHNIAHVGSADEGGDLEDGVDVVVFHMGPSVAITTPADGFAAAYPGTVAVTGTSTGVHTIELQASVGGGDYAVAIHALPAADGTWSATYTTTAIATLALKAVGYGESTTVETDPVTGTVLDGS